MKNGGGCWSVGSRKGERHALLTANPSLPLVCLPFLLLPVTFLDVISAIVSPQHPPPPQPGGQPYIGRGGAVEVGEEEVTTSPWSWAGSVWSPRDVPQPILPKNQ